MPASKFFTSLFVLAAVTLYGFSAMADCVAKKARGESEIGTYPAGPELVSATNFVPSGTVSEFGLNTPYSPGASYSGKIEANFDRLGVGKYFQDIERNALNISRMPDDHPLVKKGFVDKGDTLVTIYVPSEIGGFWPRARFYVYACEPSSAEQIAAKAGPREGSPKAVSSTMVSVSSPYYSASFALVLVVLLYVLSAITAKFVDPSVSPNAGKLRWLRYLDPVYMTAGSDGKGSLSKLQILFFSTIVFGLLTYIWARTGVLSDLSATILTLLGIAAVGSTTAKATDLQKNRLDAPNLIWFIRKKWLPAVGLAAVNEASWRDIISSDGEFDVYRYQNCIFTLVVGLSLLFAGITELASFTIPETLLGVLGLSQVVYVAGKLVTPPSFSDLNKATNEVRDIEKQFFETALAKQDPNSPSTDVKPPEPPQDLEAAIRRAGSDKYAEYKRKVEDLRTQFELVIGKAIADGAVMAPRFQI
jgi:hypothetical protein